MNILVTGAAGFIGQRIVARLLADGHNVVAHRRSGGLEKGNLRVLQGDLERGINLPPDIDFVIHAAAAGRPSLATETSIRSNLDATRRLLEAMKVAQVRRLIFLSSMAAIGLGDGPLVDELSIPVNPQPYGMLKYLCERLLDEAPFESLSLRLPNVVGAGCHSHFIAEMYAKLIRDEPISAFNPDGLFNSVVHVDALTNFIADLAIKPWSGTHILCLGASEPMKIKNLVSLLADACGSRSPIEWAEAPRPPYLIRTEAAQSIGYRPQTVRHAVESYAIEELRHLTNSNGKVHYRDQFRQV